jgi:hypothetical protein
MLGESTVGKWAENSPPPNDHACENLEGQKVRLSSEKLSERIMTEDNARFGDVEVSDMHKLRVEFAQVNKILLRELNALSLAGM